MSVDEIRRRRVGARYLTDAGLERRDRARRVLTDLRQTHLGDYGGRP